MSKIIVIAGTHSGVGKTTVSMGLMAYFVNQNMTVQPFKVGPDYIDPTHHSAICKRPSINLDTYLMSKAGVRETISKTIGDADISIVEGVMGLFDGMDSTEIASTAHVAKSIGAPVILVVNVKGMSRSAAALIKGYMEFDNKLNIKGVILNQVGSMRHVELIKNSLPENVKIVGALPKNENVKVPSRHLGLYMASERNHDISIISQFIEENVDTNAILSIAEDNSFEPMNVKNDDDYLNENKENQRFSSANISSRNVHK
ncbi:MAG: cobyrinate a,c-diamide synthase, partial [Methanosarcinaceae archaeon]|nr:cobyrinate a,c-diamide synthase [Methanosarcinaceae archaeon]MCD5425563.1 cobyrinate a,c-diamide synthase [Methanosarcinaceae archaeon]